MKTIAFAPIPDSTTSIVLVKRDDKISPYVVWYRDIHGDHDTGMYCKTFEGAMRAFAKRCRLKKCID